MNHKKTPKLIRLGRTRPLTIYTAEARGFEPLVPVKVRRFSRPLLSTTQPRFRKNYIFFNVSFSRYFTLSLPFPLFKNNSSLRASDLFLKT